MDRQAVDPKHRKDNKLQSLKCVLLMVNNNSIPI